MFCRFCFICFVILLNGFSSWSQWFQPSAGRMIDGLKSMGVDSILCFNNTGYGMGMWVFEDSIICYTPDYLFWKENGKLYSQKIKTCGDYAHSNLTTSYSSIVQIDSTTVYDFLDEHFNSIFESELLPMVIKRNDKGIEYYETPVLFHPTHYWFSLEIGDERKSKEIRTDYLEEVYSIFGEKNLNYLYNLSTPIWKFMDLLFRQTGQLEEKKMYTFK